MNGWRSMSMLMVVLLLLFTGGCTRQQAALSPKNPVELNLWHSFEGAQFIAFEESVREFNTTVGLENGVHITSSSLGSMQNLIRELNRTIRNGRIQGPDLFTMQPWYAVELEGMDLLADLDEYFTAEALEGFLEIYVEASRGLEESLILLPVTRTVDIGILNKTDFDLFLQRHGSRAGVDYRDLETLEGLMRTARAYYEWTDSLTPDIPNDGRALYAVSSLQNIASGIAFQLGNENGLVVRTETGVEPAYTRDMVHLLWEFYYCSIVRGYADADGRASSRMNTGDVIYLLAATTDVPTFPRFITRSNGQAARVELMTLPRPYTESGRKVAVQQGDSFSVAKSDARTQQAAALFLKWFAEDEKNLEFAVRSSAMPVRKESMQRIIQEPGAVVDEYLSNDDAWSKENLLKMMETYGSMFEEYEFAFITPYRQQVDTRAYLAALTEAAAKARARVVAELEEAPHRYEELMEQYTSEAAFQEWYQSFDRELREILMTE